MFSVGNFLKELLKFWEVEKKDIELTLETGRYFCPLKALEGHIY